MAALGAVSLTSWAAVADPQRKTGKNSKVGDSVDKSNAAAALTLNRRSAELYRSAHYAEAAELLREAYRLTPDPVIQYNLGRACERMADYVCAIAAYERYLASGVPPDRAAVEALLRHCRERLAAEAGAAAPMPEPSELAEPEPRAAHANEGSTRSSAPPIIVAAGVVGMGVGAALVLAANAAHATADRALSQVEGRTAQDRAERLMSGANICLIGGAVLATTGAIWWVVDQTAPPFGGAAARGRAPVVDARSGRRATPPTTSVIIGARSVGLSVAF